MNSEHIDAQLWYIVCSPTCSIA